MLHIAICDDNPLHIEEIARCTREILSANHVILHPFSTGTELIVYLKKSDCPIEIVLLDIELEAGEDGIHFAQQINRIRSKIQIIFITGNIEHATEAGEADFAYFVTKPIELGKLRRALLKAKANLTHSNIVFHLRGEDISIAQNDILYVERIQRISYVHTQQKLFEVSEKLESILFRLDIRSFTQCHKSFLINFEHISAFKSCAFVLKNGTSIPISRQYSKNTTDAYADYQGGLLP